MHVPESVSRSPGFVRSVASGFRVVSALGLIVLAGGGLVFTRNAHVTMCMLGAIAFAVCLLLLRVRAWAAPAASFLFGWILFYTHFTGSTFLAVERVVGDIGLFADSPVSPREAWTYHLLVNVPLFMLFALREERMAFVARGVMVAMISTPAMLLFSVVGRHLWESEPPLMIAFHATVGVALLALYLAARARVDVDARLARARGAPVALLAAYSALAAVVSATLALGPAA